MSLLEQCKEQHLSCRQQTAKPLLPKRIILLNQDASAQITVRLFEPINQRSPYVALSHCWGQHQNCITVQKSLTSRKAGISWQSIPKTFQEAIQLTLSLGFRFIWIDCLCIVQDDADDWEVQSSLMSEIYQDAALTIAATSSSGDNEGCCSKNAQHVPAIELTSPEHISQYRIAVRRPLVHWHDETTKSLRSHFPLLTRGWAFQERLLSPRVLHVCGSELVWECRETSHCECGGLGQFQSPGGSYHHAVENSQEDKRQHEIAQRGTTAIEEDHDFNLRGLQRRLDPFDAEPPPAYEDVVSPLRTDSSFSSTSLASVRTPTPDDDILAFAAQSNIPVYQDVTPVNEMDVKDCPDLVFHYHRIVEQYSALRLTKPSDRLPAFAGLCKRVQHLRNNYLAGLWSDSICYDLLWRVGIINLDTESNGARSTDYRGPTWSWISVDSPISYWSDITNFSYTHDGFPSYNGISKVEVRRHEKRHTTSQHILTQPSTLLRVATPTPFQWPSQSPDRTPSAR